LHEDSEFNIEKSSRGVTGIRMHVTLRMPCVVTDLAPLSGHAGSNEKNYFRLCRYMHTFLYSVAKYWQMGD